MLKKNEEKSHKLSGSEKQARERKLTGKVASLKVII
jgi:hypothetical protein